MIRSCKPIMILLMVLLLAAAGWLSPVRSHAFPTTSAAICASDNATPPFLSGGVDPNLLLAIDNSGSMLDPAYVEDGSNCYDDTYDNTQTYAGYFKPSVLYIYNLTSRAFELWAGQAYWATARDAAGATLYYTSNVAYVVMNSGPSVTGFIASGNFLNWAAASKIDIQKKILTGGKYDAAAGRMIMESRGCGNYRFVKEYAFASPASATPYSLTMAVLPPREETFGPWTSSTPYTVGSIVNDGGTLYICTATGTSGTVSTDDDNTLASPPAPRWGLYTKTRWTAGAPYVVGDIVTDPNKANTLDKGQLYLATRSGTAGPSGGVVADNASASASVPKWEPYNVTQIEIFETIAGGFNNEACQAAVEELNSESPNQGQIKQDIDECMDDNALASGNSGDISNFNAAFNHSIHNCWYTAKHDTWPPGSGPVNAIQPACEAIYPTSGPTEPWNITPEVGGYVCYGLWDNDNDSSTNTGYVGRCWKPGSGTPVCEKCKDKSVADPADCPPADCTKWDSSGVTPGGWDAAGYASVDDCIEQGLKDYCGVTQIPEVVDPSDQVVGTSPVTGVTEEFWNIPALLTDSGVLSQLGRPLLIMNGFIAAASAPSGLIQEFAGDLRMGAMVFNHEGSAAECNTSDPFVLYNCTDPTNRDAGKVIAPIDKSAAHTAALVSAINSIKATSWTPLAEAVYNAIGYYAQRSDMRLNAADFKIVGVDSGAVDPITAYCQDNNILIITEGASTADLHPDMVSFAQSIDVPDSSATASCGTLSGSTLLDDLTWFAKNSDTCHVTQITDADGNPQDKQNIATHIVVAGTLRDTGAADECNPKVLLEAAAANGGTALYEAADPTQLENTLRSAFAAIRAGAAAGSAASVISASRSGEGAAYQAIFWPSVDLASGDKVEWIGEVHSLLVDAFGQLYEDSNGNHALDADDQRIVFFFDTSINQTKACLGELSAAGVCSGTVKNLEDVKYHWSAAQWLAEIEPTAASAAASGDILQNRTVVGTDTGYISNVKKRYIFTWNDLNNDGIVTGNELLDFAPGATWSGLAVSGGRGPVPLDFGVQTDAEVDKVIRWARGLDYTPDNLRLRQMSYDFDHSGTSETVTWRLGDVIHSTPISVGAPAEGFHFLYRDNSYAQFITAYKNRRHMIYFGGNDGMMHAVNGGFYNEAQKKFCNTSDCSDSTTAPELGAELWAYVPYNLLPHLKCLTSPGYQHKYYVDQRPRIFDVRLWDPNDATHVGGWGTILVGAMRLGGGKVQPGVLDLNGDSNPDYAADNREFTSSYFIMDITDPEKPPKLLAEMTRTTSGQAELGYSYAIPTLVVMRDEGPPVTYNWYLIMGSGPTSVSGTSNQSASLAVLPLNWLGLTPSVSAARAFRIPFQAPSAGNNEGGQFVLSYTSNSFVSDPISVDFELEENFKTDVVYFGTVSGTSAPYSGGMQRLVTRRINAVTGKQEGALPSEWRDLLKTAPFTNNQSALDNPLPLINTNQPVTASASVGTDGKNYWIYFGTGRFMDTADKSDANTQTYYGIKEPLSFSGIPCKSAFTWQTVEKTASNGWNTTPGEQGLLDVTKIKVAQATTASTALLSCSDASACLTIESPAGTTNTLTTFDTLVDYIAGTGTGCNHPATDSNGTDGWFKDFTLTKERNLGQATLLGGLVTYTSYQPYADPCLPEGLGYLYGVYFKTGTPFYIPVFISAFSAGVDAGGNVIDRVDLGRGLSTTPNLHVGKQEGAKAFVQTSTGTIVEIPQPNLPIQNAKTGKASWGEIK